MVRVKTCDVTGEDLGETWFDRFRTPSEIKADQGDKDFVLRFGALFQKHRYSRHWFYLLVLVVSTMEGIALGLVGVAGADVQLYVLILIALIEVLLYALLRPYFTAFSNGIHIVCKLCHLLVVVIALAFVPGSYIWIGDSLQSREHATSLMLIFIFLPLILNFFRVSFHSGRVFILWLRRRNLKKAMKKKRKEEGGIGNGIELGDRGNMKPPEVKRFEVEDEKEAKEETRPEGFIEDDGKVIYNAVTKRGTSRVE